ncbi:N-acetyltransferase [Christensenellaceae bacterium OttesenSCG-928-K19]|nr:N-acetyltransferase [Christensenellaceae bacterium OttesenSCG-928-K19]
MDILLRQERQEDHLLVELLTHEAFRHMALPGRARCDEHFLAHQLRQAAAFVPSLDYVALADGKIVGNIMYVQSSVVEDNGKEHTMLTFGPLSVLPSFQGRGIGARLVTTTIELAKKLPYPAIFIFGHPDYYRRFGFRNAKEFGITTSEGKNFDAFMALELHKGALAGIHGKFYEGDAYQINDRDFEAYEQSFPVKEGD